MAGHGTERLVWYYLAASGVSFLFYLVDKAAARNGRQRIPERLLHLCGVAGGWPGGLLAQQLLRHKTRKTSFQLLFWGSVLLNCGILILLLSRL